MENSLVSSGTNLSCGDNYFSGYLQTNQYYCYICGAYYWGNHVCHYSPWVMIPNITYGDSGLEKRISDLEEFKKKLEGYTGKDETKKLQARVLELQKQLDDEVAKNKKLDEQLGTIRKALNSTK